MLPPGLYFLVVVFKRNRWLLYNIMRRTVNMVNFKRTVTSRGSQTRVMKIVDVIETVILNLFQDLKRSRGQEIPKQVRDDNGNDRKAELPLLITYQYSPCRCTVTSCQFEGQAVQGIMSLRNFRQVQSLHNHNPGIKQDLVSRTALLIRRY